MWLRETAALGAATASERRKRDLTRTCAREAVLPE